MRHVIPGAALSVCAKIVADRETHATLHSLFVYAGATGDPPEGSKLARALAWLRSTNKDETVNPLDVLGRVIEDYMERPLDPEDFHYKRDLGNRELIEKTLATSQLRYHKGGKITGVLGTPSRSLEEYILNADSAAIDMEFDRALSSVDQNPRDAVSAASNIVESICKLYIAKEGLDVPAKQDIKSVWTPVRKHLGFDPSLLEDQDLQQILSGLISIVEGIGALRTHASSAHGAGVKTYKLEARHARLAVHSSHTLALFVLESWQKRKSTRLS